MKFLHRRRQAQVPIELNVIPLIDVVFFLLIFYVISTTFMHESSVSLARPTSSQSHAVHGSFLPVAVVASGVIQIGSQCVAVAEVEAAVRVALAAGSTDKVVVIPDRSVPTGLLLEVMDACTAAGAVTVDVAATASPR